MPGGGGSSRPAELLRPGKAEVEKHWQAAAHLLLPVLQAPHLEEQVEKVKQAVVGVDEETKDALAEVLVMWYFTSPLKSSVRKVIGNCMNSTKSTQLAEAVTEQVTVKVSSLCKEEEDTSMAISRILGCFDNCKLGEAGVAAAGDQVPTFLMSTVERRVEEGCEPAISPVDRASSLDQAGEALRALLYVIKARGKAGAEGELAHSLLNNQQLPLDLRSNAGIIYVWVKTHTGKQEELEQELTNPGTSTLEAKLSLLNGVLSSYTNEDLKEGETKRGLLTTMLSAYLDIGDNLEQETIVVLARSRGVLHWSTKFLDFCKTTSTCGGSVTLLDKMWEYVWAHLDHSVDSVKHNTKGILGNLVQGLVAGGCSKEVERLLEDAKQLPKDSKARLVAFTCLLRHQSDSVIASCPNLASDTLALAGEQAIVGHVSNLYQQILTNTFKNQPDIWFENSVKPLLVLFSKVKDRPTLDLVSNLLKAAVKLCPGVTQRLVVDGETSDPRLALACLKMAREAAAPWHFAKHADLLKRALEHCEVEVRLQALRLMVESHSSVEVVNQVELDLLLPFIRLHLALQSPSAQQEFLVLIKKLIARIVDGAAAMTKKMTQKKFDGEKEAFTSHVADYSSWLRALLRTLLGSLFPGANFPRRVSSLELLYCLANSVGFNAPRHGLDLRPDMTTEASQTLLACLEDPYESNKELALSILHLLPPTLLNLHSPPYVSSLLSSLLSLASSSKPPDSLTACAQAKLILKAPALPWVLADKLGLVKSRLDANKLLSVVVVKNQLVKQVEAAERNLLDAAVDSPMYGTVAVLRALYQQLDKSEYSQEWTELTAEVVAVCYRVWEVARAVVASDSPEGHLPMDYGTGLQKVVQKSLGGGKGQRPKRDGHILEGGSLYTVVSRLEIKEVFPDEVAEELVEELVDAVTGKEASSKKQIPELGPEIMRLQFEGKKEKGELSDENEEEKDMVGSEAGKSKAREVSSQMLLLCAWRSVKEVSLLLGSLCATFSATKAVNLVSVRQIQDISEFLISLLLETKHRGAFEQAYVAFCSLVASLWQSPAPELHALPSSLLADLLKDIEDGGKRKSLCATRRSAGVPFIVQAVVVGEGVGGGVTLRSTMARLLQLAKEGSSETRVHSLNILRALFRDSRLGDAITSFLEGGVTVSITGFKASNWAERTAATLLFSALMTRIFGVKRDKEAVISSKNCLTGKVFFQRHPGLHAFLLSQFEEGKEGGCEKADGVQQDSALYPLLLLLARLFPSPTETVNNPYPLSSFLPFVKMASTSSLLHTRRLAASALASLVAVEDRPATVVSILTSLQEADQLPPQNTLHGQLLQLEKLLERNPELATSFKPLLILADKLVTKNPCSLTQAAFVQLCCSLLPHWQQEENLETAELESLLLKPLEEEEEEGEVQVWRPLLLRAAASFVVRTSLHCNRAEGICKLLTHCEHEVREEVLLLVPAAENQQLLEAVTDAVHARLGNEQHPGCIEALLKACCILPRPVPEQNLSLILELSENSENDEVRATGLKLLSRAMVNHESPSNILPWASLILAALAPEQGLLVRLAACKALASSTKLLTSLPEKEEGKVARVLLWAAALRMLQQDEEEVRAEVSNLYFAFSGENVAPEVAGGRLVVCLVKEVGKAWPNATLLVILGALLTAMFDTESDSEVDTEVDRAFDKNEVNCYEEAISLALTLLPHTGSYLRRLSPRLQSTALSSPLPASLLQALLPDLPAAVSLYTVMQVLEYLAARASSCKVSPLEQTTTTMLFCCMRCPLTEQLCSSYIKERGEQDRDALGYFETQVLEAAERKT